jgi:hypothetical protein
MGGKAVFEGATKELKERIPLRYLARFVNSVQKGPEGLAPTPVVINDR